ncbi:MAG: NRDE family protein [Rhodospirillaceae bacterium]|nr:NRDE family protein [Rhodospirillaceae bacterium]
MCTVVILRRPGHAWPVILGANRDEMLNRPWLPPARHWDDRPDVVGGKDELAGGTWMGLNDTGVVACILNRHGTLGPAAGKRSRGELVLEALDHPDAATAAEALSEISPRAYRPFNLVIADNRDAWWVALTGDKVRVKPIPTGISMFTAFERNDPADPRIGGYLPRFEAAPTPDPDAKDWKGWQDLLGTTGGEGERAMSFRLASGFGTSSSSLVALPSVARAFGAEKMQPVWLFAPGAPESTAYQPVNLS